MIKQFGRLMSAYTHAIAPPELPRDLDFRPLTEDEIRSLRTEDPVFRQRQSERLARFGRSYAYGVFLGGKIAHVSWLLPAAVVRLERPLLLLLREDEAEITGCETLPAYRGMGIYAFAIRKLFGLARAQGLRRIFMKTTAKNKSSQSGIHKAGLKRIGSAVVIVPPAMPGRTVVCRFYR